MRDQAYMSLVGVAATAKGCTSFKRVVPNKPDESLLYLVLTRTSAGSCDPPDMPSGGMKWDQEYIDQVKAWIEAGAQNN